MPTLIEYLVKLSVSLAVVWLFYQFVLRRLTFYNHNRWYLLVYSLLSFVIPFIDITPALNKNELTASNVIQWVPLLYGKTTANSSLSLWNVLSIVIITGMLFILTRLLIQLFSFRKMMRKATLISGEDIQLYQVYELIIPFSFGNAVFFNINLHTTEELEKIILHEFVHVKQRHSIDIIFSEILCLFNWYNPFAWLIRASIRQNLEFVADNKVLENGINKKQYQYLLLKVIGNNQFSIAQKFNFSSLKKRIAMMNKNKSTKMHLLRFLFVLPVLALILVSFRKEIGDTLNGKQNQLQLLPAVTTDSIPEVTAPNSKGYIINVKDKKGECLLVIKDKTGKEVNRVLLTEWNANAEKFEATYGEIPPPPAPHNEEVWGLNDFLKRNPGVEKIGYVFNSDNTVAIYHIIKKDGSSEEVDMRNEANRKAGLGKYGEFPVASLPPPAAPVAPDAVELTIAPTPPVPPAPVQLPANVQKININNDKATVTLKNGGKENYDLNKPEQKAWFEKKYGELTPPPPPPARELSVKINTPSELVEKEKSGEFSPRVEIRQRLSGELVPNAQTQPLFVIDGVVASYGGISQLNPNNITKMKVLKGTSAIEVYGDKGKNGIIEITTKGNDPDGVKGYMKAKEMKFSSTEKINGQ